MGREGYVMWRCLVVALDKRYFQNIIRQGVTENHRVPRRPLSLGTSGSAPQT